MDKESERKLDKDISRGYRATMEYLDLALLDGDTLWGKCAIMCKNAVRSCTLWKMPIHHKADFGFALMLNSDLKH